MISKLVNILNDLCNTLDQKYDINCGGCCYVASEIAKHLDKRHIKYSLCVLNDAYLDRDAINQEVQNKCINSLECKSVSGNNTCVHYFINIENEGSINVGDFSDDYLVYAITGINYKNIKWLYRTGDWNPCYDIYNNRKIRRKIKLCFDRYDKIYFNENK